MISFSDVCEAWNCNFSAGFNFGGLSAAHLLNATKAKGDGRMKDEQIAVQMRVYFEDQAKIQKLILKHLLAVQAQQGAILKVMTEAAEEMGSM